MSGQQNRPLVLIVTFFSSDDKYINNLLDNDGIKVEYIKEDLLQVNPQLYNRLAIINNKSSSNNSISQPDNTVNNAIHNKGDDTETGKVIHSHSEINDGLDKSNSTSVELYEDKGTILLS